MSYPVNIKVSNLFPGAIVDIENFQHHDNLTDKLMAAYQYAEVDSIQKLDDGAYMVHFTEHSSIKAPAKHAFPLIDIDTEIFTD